MTIQRQFEIEVESQALDPTHDKRFVTVEAKDGKIVVTVEEGKYEYSRRPVMELDLTGEEAQFLADAIWCIKFAEVKA